MTKEGIKKQILEQFEYLIEKCPQLRVGQLLVNIIEKTSDLEENQVTVLFYIEDDKLLEKMFRFELKEGIR